MSIAAMTAIVLILLTLTGVLRHTVEETGIKNTHVIYWLICVICLKAFLLNPTPEIELNFGLVPIIIGPVTRDEAVFFFVTGERVQFRILPLLAAAKPDFIPAHLCWLKNGSIVGGE